MNVQELTKIGQALCGTRWQAPFARLLGVAPVTVSRWIKGKQKISPALEKAIYRLSDKPPLMKPKEKRLKPAGAIFQDAHMTLMHGKPNLLSLSRVVDTIICLPFDAKPLPGILLVEEPTQYLREILCHLGSELSVTGKIIIVLPTNVDPRILNAVPQGYPYIDSLQLPSGAKQIPKTVYQFGGEGKQQAKHACIVEEGKEGLELEAWLLKHYSDSQDVICDPFMGEGRLAHAAFKADKQYIGIEPELRYWRWGRAMLARGFVPDGPVLRV